MKIEQVRTFIQKEILRDEAHEIGLDEDLLLSDTLDSLSVMRLVQHIEKEAGLRIPPEDVTLENFQSLGQIDAYLAGRRS